MNFKNLLLSFALVAFLNPSIGLANDMDLDDLDDPIAQTESEKPIEKAKAKKATKTEAKKSKTTKNMKKKKRYKKRIARKVKKRNKKKKKTDEI